MRSTARIFFIVAFAALATFFAFESSKAQAGIIRKTQDITNPLPGGTVDFRIEFSATVTNTAPFNSIIISDTASTGLTYAGTYATPSGSGSLIADTPAPASALAATLNLASAPISSGQTWSTTVNVGTGNNTVPLGTVVNGVITVTYNVASSGVVSGTELTNNVRMFTSTSASAISTRTTMVTITQPLIGISGVVTGAEEGPIAAIVTLTSDIVIASAITVSLQYTDGSAISTTDYSASVIVVNWPAGAQEIAVSIPVTDDTLFQNDHIFTIGVVTYTNSPYLVAPITGTSQPVTITDNEYDLRILKSVAPSVSAFTPGDDITFTMELSHVFGSFTATNITISDVMPSGIDISTVVITTSSGTADAVDTANRTASVSAITIGSGGPTVNITVTAKVAPISNISQTFTNTVYIVNAIGDRLAPTSTVNNTATAVFTVGMPNLIITKTGGGSTLFPGDTITFAIDIANTGFVTSSVLTLTDSLPTIASGLTISPSSVFTVAAIAPGGTANTSVTVTVPSTHKTNLDGIVNTITLSAAADVATTDNTTTSTAFTVTAQPDLSVTKTVNPSGAPTVTFSAPSNILTYTIVISNSSAATATCPVNITDMFPAISPISVTNAAGISGPGLTVAATSTGFTATIAGGNIGPNTSYTIIYTATVGVPAAGTFASPVINTVAVTTENELNTIADATASVNLAQVQMSVAAQSVNEAAGTVPVTFTLNTTLTTAVSFVITTTNGSALAGTDYTPYLSHVITIPANSTSVVFNIPIIDDTFVEGAAGETFIVTMANATLAALGNTTSQTITIIDNDTPLGTTTPTPTPLPTTGTSTPTATNTPTVTPTPGAATNTPTPTTTAVGTSIPSVNTPTATSTAAPTDTATPVPATDTPVPSAATDTPVPAATDTPDAGGGEATATPTPDAGGGEATATPTPDAGGGEATATPTLDVGPGDAIPPVPVVQTPVGGGGFQPGNVVLVTVIVTNDSNVVSLNTLLNFIIPNFLSFVAAQSTPGAQLIGTAADTSQTLLAPCPDGAGPGTGCYYNLGDLDPGASTELTLAFQVDALLDANVTSVDLITFTGADNLAGSTATTTIDLAAPTGLAPGDEPFIRSQLFFALIPENN